MLINCGGRLKLDWFQRLISCRWTSSDYSLRESLKYTLVPQDILVKDRHTNTCTHAWAKKGSAPTFQWQAFIFLLMNIRLARINMCIFKSLIVFKLYPWKDLTIKVHSLKTAFIVYLKFYKKSILISLALKPQAQNERKKKEREPLSKRRELDRVQQVSPKKGKKMRGREHPAWVKGRTETRQSGWLKNRHILAAD